jgi:hypothetical protein
MRSAKDFFTPLAVGAPAPVHEVPARPSRMIHFVDPSNPRMAAKVPQLVGTVDVLLGNLEDASCGPGSTRSTPRGRSTTSPPWSPRSATGSTS